MLSLFLFLALLGLLFLYHLMSWQPLDTSILYQNHDFLLFGHRGSPEKQPENTISSFKQAVADGCNAVELDVFCSRDGQLVVFHDETLERTTDGTGEVVTHTLSQLQSLNAAKIWPGRNETIPTLNDVIDSLPDDIIVNIEIKNYAVISKQKIEEKLVSYIREKGLDNRVIISSFNPVNLWKVKQADPSLFTALLWYEPSWYSPRYVFGLHIAHPDILHPAQEDMNSALRFWARFKKLPLHVWVVNDAEKMDQLKKDSMVKGIMSDDTELLIKTVANKAV